MAEVNRGTDSFNEIDRKSLANQVRDMDSKSDEFTAVAAVMAEKTAELREEEKLLPYELFIATLRQAGFQPTVEYLVTDTEGNLYLRRREAHENQSQAEQASWGGRLHIPGSALNPAKQVRRTLFDLLDREIVAKTGDSDNRKRLAKLYRTGEIYAVVSNPEPERYTKTVTILVKITVDDPAALKQGFERVNPDDLSNVIEQHRPTIRQYFSPKKGLKIFDTWK